ncbi:DNA adenine methylase [Cyanophage S-RIM44]|uniref:site-specific DNA-methyltransferase (adenine-specific) n=2 Tax=Vellamovirus TaxID=2733139 RepID=A0A127KMU4_9CAUD|nr:DNA methyltransferase [Prochlorococcus phage Syn1]AMO43387.1 DNA adenine methylase [Cyanophage S-RIM44]ADO99245.1 DNA adenine methylase [Prochlorococcus phage Syn1]AOO11859.1 DNA adenine methylase [Cyanophage S-RIM44]AOO12560.1 DNA adenine methylase [Cyanophage S-RIM44]AOO13026.1 DNA adenine methylase [Cyanophage S-RIM44]
MIQTLKSLKTPLRYPGGKSRALSKLFQYIPDLKDYTEYREPFLGGGSVALEVSKRYPHLNIWVNDLYEPLYNFWRELQDHGQALRDELVQLKQRHIDRASAKNLFLDAKAYLERPVEDTEDFHRAVSFYVVNKCSFSGLTESSSFSPQASDSNFSMAGIDRLPEYQKLIANWKITNLSYEQLLCDDKSVYIYLDPPYEIGSNLYGKRGNMHKGFDHDKFAADCDRFISHQLVSYNSSQLIRDRFEKGWTAAEFAHTYTMRSVGSYNTDQASRKELVLTNYEM